jgi:hypothetical protein
MKSKATDASSVVEWHLHITFPKLPFRFYARTVLIQGPADSGPRKKIIFPAMASNSQVAYLSLMRIHDMFAGAQACKWMVTKWAHSYFRFRELTDEPLQDTQK